MRNISTFAAIAFVAAGTFAASSAFAVEVQLDKEIAAAASHAGYAAAAGDIDGVRAHLHHTINCLAGPAGKGFDAKQMNPCAALGNGAIADASDKGTIMALEAAQASAEDAIAESDFAKAQAGATAVQSMLSSIE